MNRKDLDRTVSAFPHDRFVAGDPCPEADTRHTNTGSAHDRPTGLDPVTVMPAGRRRLGIVSLVGVLGTMLLADVGAALFVAQERTIYIWDFANYWMLSRAWAAIVRGPSLEALQTLLHSIATDDYNLLAATPVGTWIALAGQSRMSYILGIVNIYVALALVSLLMLVRRFWGDREARLGPSRELIPAAVLLLVPTVWVPVLRGYVDIGGMAIAFLVLRLYFSPSDRSPFHPAFLGIGILLAGLYLFRRWYAFWIVSFLMVAALDRLVLAFQDGRERGFNLRRAVRHLVPIPVVGGIMALAIAALALPLVRRVLATNYSDIYSAYNNGTLWNLRILLGYFGVAQALYALIAALGLLVFRETRRISLFLCVQAILIVYQFNRVQYFAMHHTYLLLPGFLVLVSVFVMKVAGILPGRGLRYAWLGLVAALGLATSIPVFYGPARALARSHARLFADPCPPLVRYDVGEVVRMLSVLDRHLQKEDGRLYVLAASYQLTSDHLRFATASLPVPFRSTERVIPSTASVDKRDGFPRELLDAQFVLVATPTQYTLKPEDGQVLGMPVDSLLKGRDIGGAFERLPEGFSLEKGVKAYLYRKTRAIRSSEIAQLSERLRGAYPDRPFIYRP